MLVIEYEEIEVDYCDSCCGVWLDEGELELLFGNESVTQEFLTGGNPTAVGNEKQRPCPICDALMGKAVTGGAEPVVYDCCSSGHGLWFDKGELMSILKLGSASGVESPVVQWLRQIFPDAPVPPSSEAS
jgi:Zn-finger nucleic acid-binding protein